MFITTEKDKLSTMSQIFSRLFKDFNQCMITINSRRMSKKETNRTYKGKLFLIRFELFTRKLVGWLAGRLADWLAIIYSTLEDKQIKLTV